MSATLNPAAREKASRRTDEVPAALFSDEHTVAVVFSDTITAMCMTPDRFAGFTTRPTTDGVAETIIALGVDARDEVDRIADAALAGGGATARDPQDHGFMYLRSFLDPDGHHWEVAWMDPNGMPG